MASRIRSDERGFLLVELLVAALLAAIGLSAVIASFDYSRAATTSAERSETAIHEAQRELEHIASMDYDAIGMSSAVAYVNNERDPRYFVRNGGTSFQWDRSDTTLVGTLAAGGTLATSSAWQSVSDGGTRFTGAVWRFVTWYYDPLLVQAGTDLPDAKRAIVAVTVDGNSEPRKPLFVSTMVRDPGD